MSVSDPILSPCIGICELNNAGYCIGCKRSTEEIAVWGLISAAERDQIMDALEDRTVADGDCLAD